MAKEDAPIELVQEVSASRAAECKAQVAEKWQGTNTDKHDMLVLGRTQQLRRNFNSISILGFGATLICTWEAIITLFGLSLSNGGTAGLIYGFLYIAFTYSLIYLSIAELASMSPTAGGQYHWISEFSPPSCQKYLSYLSGWLTVTGWQTGIAGAPYMISSSIQALIILHEETYVFQRWHASLMAIALVFGAMAFNTVGAKRLPLVEGLVLLVHVCGFFAVAIPMWALAPRKPASAVFTEFNNNGGWPSIGLSFFVGIGTLSASMAGIDSVVHMAEEVENASRTVPRALLMSIPLNVSLGIAMVLTLCFCTPDVDALLASPVGVHGFPHIQLFYDTTQNLGAATVMAIIPLISLLGSLIAVVATGSRQMWSFARDGGLPFAAWIAGVNSRWTIPLNALLISLVINCLLPMINIASTAALNAISSLSGVALISSYVICIGCLLLKRLRGEPLPTGPFSLGRFGILVNVLSLCLMLPIAIFLFFPPVIPITVEGMNWGCLMFGSMLIFSTVYYLIYGKHTYVPPVRHVNRDIKTS